MNFFAVDPTVDPAVDPTLGTYPRKYKYFTGRKGSVYTSGDAVPTTLLQTNGLGTCATATGTNPDIPQTGTLVESACPDPSSYIACQIPYP